MSLSEAMDQIAKKMVPGVVRYYEHLPQDPWMDNMDFLEKQLNEPALYGPPDLKRFTGRAIELIERFKRDSVPASRITPADAFHMAADPVNLEASISRAYKMCRKCESRTGLQPYKVTGADDKVELLCRSCAEAERKCGGR